MQTLDPTTTRGARALERLAPRNASIETNPRVCFNLDTTADGDDYVTMEGQARVDATRPPSSANPVYQAKYRHLIERYGWTPEWLDGAVPQPIDATGMVQVTDALLETGCNEAQIEAVMGGNALRLLAEVLPVG